MAKAKATFQAQVKTLGSYRVQKVTLSPATIIKLMVAALREAGHPVTDDDSVNIDIDENGVFKGASILYKEVLTLRPGSTEESRKETARRLGVSVRTLYRKMQKVQEVRGGRPINQVARDRLLDALADGASQSEAARASGYTRVHVHRLLKDPKFVALLSKRRNTRNKARNILKKVETKTKTKPKLARAAK